MKAWLWNGAAFEPTASVPLTDRGFRYGMALFESLRVWDGQVEFREPHQQRLLAACAEREFPVEERTVATAMEVLATAGMNGFARIYVTGGDGGPAGAVENPRILLMLEVREPEREESWALCLHEDTHHPLFAGLKTANYWLHCDALHQARKRGFDEALLFNEHAELVSACCANVFIVRGERILTPPRGSGCRLGVMREWVMLRRKVEERRLRREDVVKADEVFVTNSWIGVMPVATLEGRPLDSQNAATRLAGELEMQRDLVAEQARRS